MRTLNHINQGGLTTPSSTRRIHHQSSPNIMQSFTEIVRDDVDNIEELDTTDISQKKIARKASSSSSEEDCAQSFLDLQVQGEVKKFKGCQNTYDPKNSREDAKAKHRSCNKGCVVQ